MPEYRYILHIQEHLASSWSAGFEGLAVSHNQAGETYLSGDLPDQAALHGLLARIRDLNLTLISVHRAADDELPDGQFTAYQSDSNVEEKI